MPPTPIDAFNMARTSMAKANGVGPGDVPRVTNEQAASLLRMSMDNARKMNVDVGLADHWYPISLALAGWQAPGDRFLVDAKHRQSMFPDQHTAELWQLALNVAREMQQRGVAITAPTVNPSVDYTFVLKQAWAKMQRDAKATGQPQLPSPLPETVPSSAPAENSNLLPLLIIGAIALRKKGRR
jgi:hypothetical protein